MMHAGHEMMWSGCLAVSFIDFEQLFETLTRQRRIGGGWLLIGLAAQFTILCSLVLHAYASRKRRKIVVSTRRIYACLIATAVLLMYASVRHDLVFVVGQILSLMIGLRILEWVRRAEGRKAEPDRTRFPVVEPDSAEIKLKTQDSANSSPSQDSVREPETPLRPQK